MTLKNASNKQFKQAFEIMTVNAFKLWMWKISTWRKEAWLPSMGKRIGKSTFLNLIAGIVQPDGGEIKLNGLTLNGLTENQRDQLRASSIGYIFQSFNLLQGYSALENLEISMAWGGKVDPAKARRLLDAVGLSDRIHHFTTVVA